MAANANIRIIHGDDISAIDEALAGIIREQKSGGLADFNEKTDAKLHDVFERADASMYREKKALKALGAHSR